MYLFHLGWGGILLVDQRRVLKCMRHVLAWVVHVENLIVVKSKTGPGRASVV